MKFLNEPLRAEIAHPEHPELVFVIERPADAFQTLALLKEVGDTLSALTPEKIAGDFAGATDALAESASKLIKDIRGAEGADGPIDYQADPKGALRLILSRSFTLTFPGKDAEGGEIRVPVVNEIIRRFNDPATFGLDPEGKASPAPQTAS